MQRASTSWTGGTEPWYKETSVPGCASLALLVNHQSSLLLSMKDYLSCSNNRSLSGTLSCVFAVPDTGYWLMPVKRLTHSYCFRAFIVLGVKVHLIQYPVSSFCCSSVVFMTYLPSCRQETWQELWWKSWSGQGTFISVWSCKKEVFKMIPSPVLMLKCILQTVTWIPFWVLVFFTVISFLKIYLEF